MTTPPVWVSDLAARFWSLAGPPPEPPRDLSQSITDTLPLGIIRRDGLTLTRVTEFLHRQGLPVLEFAQDRPLQAALFAWQGQGYIFVDSTDCEDERRISLAHELAHYLRDYDEPRQRAVRSLGPTAREILDGIRPPTFEERMAALFRRVLLEPHLHLMNRNATGRPSSEVEQAAEDGADRLGFELLAPANGFVDETSPFRLIQRLVAEFRFPVPSARRYAQLLMPVEEPSRSLVSRIRKFW